MRVCLDTRLMIQSRHGEEVVTFNRRWLNELTEIKVQYESHPHAVIQPIGRYRPSIDCVLTAAPSATWW